MYRQYFLDQSPDELRHTIPAKEYFESRVIAAHSPFHPLSGWAKLKQWIAGTLVRSLEFFVRKKLYVENDLRELAPIDSRIRRVIRKVIERGLINTWSCGFMIPDGPRIMACHLNVSEVVTPKGGRHAMGGSTGGGVGKDRNEALVPALGELIERLACSVWDPKDLVRGSYKELRRKGAIDPETISYFSKEQKEGSHARSQVSADAPMNWVKAFSLTEEKSVLVPAGLVYTYYMNDYPEEPFFCEVSSNATAAGRTYKEAAYRAICEGIERDAFLIHWINQMAPPRIRIESIDDEVVQRLYQEAREDRLEILMFDMTTDLSIPVLCAFLIDQHGDIAVSVSSTADFDIKRAVRKLFYEVLKFVHAPPPSHALDLDARPRTLEERRSLWARKEMIPKLDFLREGKEIDFSDVLGQASQVEPKHYLRTIKEMFCEKGYPCYLAETTNKLAREEKIRVVRAVMPDLMSIYFNENNQYQGVRRLYEVPARLGYKKIAEIPSDFNPIPHPFV